MTQQAIIMVKAKYSNLEEVIGPFETYDVARSWLKENDYQEYMVDIVELDPPSLFEVKK